MNLSSASNRQVTLLRKLNQKKYRQKEQLFLLEGERAVEQVLKNNRISVEALFFDQEQQYWHQQPWKVHSNRMNARTLPENIFAEVSDTDNPQGVLAMCQIPGEVSVNNLTESKGIIIALDAIQDPGNLGTIIRTAAWFGVSGVISGKGTVDLFHPKVVRGTAGATGVLPHMNGELLNIFPKLKDSGWSVFLLDAGADSIPLSEVTTFDKAVVVVGNEAHGVNPELVEGAGMKVQVPSPAPNPNVESLNAAIATSIALYDLSGKVNSS